MLTFTDNPTHHGWQLPQRETWFTVATAVTVVRTIISVGLALGALVQQDMSWLYAALATYWAGDIADGLLARTLNEETRTGAVLDIVCDRLCVGVIYLSYLAINPDPLMAIALLIYLFQFMVLDTMLSLSFMLWPLLSPNYFYLVDKKIYDLNWSPVAKVANSSLFILATLFLGVWWLSLSVAVVNLSIKLYSSRWFFQHHRQLISPTS